MSKWLYIPAQGSAVTLSFSGTVGNIYTFYADTTNFTSNPTTNATRIRASLAAVGLRFSLATRLIVTLLKQRTHRASASGVSKLTGKPSLPHLGRGTTVQEQPSQTFDKANGRHFFKISRIPSVIPSTSHLLESKQHHEHHTALRFSFTN